MASHFASSFFVIGFVIRIMAFSFISEFMNFKRSPRSSLLGVRKVTSVPSFKVCRDNV